MNSNTNERVTFTRVILKLCCPNCGNGRVFSGLLTIKDQCSYCSLPLSNYQTDDGPAFFVMVPLCLIVAMCALAIDLNYAPPLWVHLIIWPPIIIITSLFALRPAKALLIAIQHEYQKEI
mgnify:CR=1 FL=1